MPELTRIVLMGAAAVILLSLLLHYDYGRAVTSYTGPPVPLAVRVPPACPVSGHAVVDGQLVPVRCGYVIDCYRVDVRLFMAHTGEHNFTFEIYADRPVPPGRCPTTVVLWCVPTPPGLAIARPVMLVGDDAVYLLASPDSSGETLRDLPLPRGASYILFGDALYAILKAPDVQFVISYDPYTCNVIETYTVHGVGPGAVHALTTDAYRVVEERAMRVGTIRLWNKALPLYIVAARLERASLARFVDLTAHVAPDAWPLFKPGVTAG